LKEVRGPKLDILNGKKHQAPRENSENSKTVVLSSHQRAEGVGNSPGAPQIGRRSWRKPPPGPKNLVWLPGREKNKKNRKKTL